MKLNSLLIAGIAAAFLAASALVADEWDKKTNITVNETIQIPGKVLPPGKYVMKLMNSSSNRHIVQVFNEDQTKLEATILAFNNYRLEPTDKTVLRYWETPAGNPPALRAWFYPGDTFGQEFAYPKNVADQISRNNNNAKVPNFEGPTQPSSDELANLTVHDIDQTRSDAAAAVATAPQPPPTVAEAPRPVTSDNTTLLAQNTPPANTPATQIAPQPVTPAAAPVSDELPRTASPVPLIAMAGFALIGLAASLRFVRV